MTSDPSRQALREVIARDGAIRVATLFGSVARGTAAPGSDVDVGVAADSPLSGARKAALIAAIGERLGRPVDLIDLQTATGIVLAKALSESELIYCDDSSLYAALIQRLLYDQADMMPYRSRILNERRRAWIGR